MIDDLIEQLTSKLGIDETTAKSATEKTMAMLKSVGGDDLFSRISSAIPGADEMATAGEAESAGVAAGGSQAANVEPSGGGMFGKLAGIASGLVGGSAGQALGLTNALGSAGLDSDKFGGFATTIIDFIKDKAGADVVDQLLDKVPMLKGLLK